MRDATLMGYLSRGKKLEDAFSQHFRHTRMATEKEDIEKHYDLVIQTRVDLKGMKKIKRSDSKPTEDYHWIEIKNVNGELGWLYGEADAFAFETEEFFILVEQRRLQRYVKKVVIRDFANTPRLHYLYKRQGRKDLLMLVKTLELCGISAQCIQKDEIQTLL